MIHLLLEMVPLHGTFVRSFSEEGTIKHRSHLLSRGCIQPSDANHRGGGHHLEVSIPIKGRRLEKIQWEKLQGRALEFFFTSKFDLWKILMSWCWCWIFAPRACSCLNKKVTHHFCWRTVLTKVLSDNHRWVLMLIDTDPFDLEGKRYQVYHWDFTITTKPSMQIIPLSSEWHPETSTAICQKKLQNTSSWSLVGFVMKRNCYCLYYACFILRLVIQIVAIIAIMGQIKH